jgi:hypothetical protein
MSALITAQIICNIIKYGMALSDDQIWVYNQRRSIPEDKKLYVTVGLMGIKVYGSTNKQTETDAGLQDETAQFVQEAITIDLFSYTTEAIERYAEVIGSMKTTYAQQLQAQYALKIAEVPISVNDVSELEGAAQLYRISITLPVLRKYSMIKDAQYYDKFSSYETSYNK